ncbi:MAG: alpha/beta hydrolase [Woeseiaceae bacterium]|nr:alpha/beta hydrolase [Woeseiaceae bacterium]
MNKILITAALLTLSGCSIMPMGARHHVQVDGDSISYVRSDGPTPTVVFEAGAGDDLTVWRDVYEDVSSVASTFAYSRPGYTPGIRRTPIGAVRTADDVSRQLRDTLAKSGSPAPYILVGHSIGGLYVLEFARDYPDLVAGLVLVDARLPRFTERCEAESQGPCLPGKSALFLSPAHVAAEIRGIRPSESGAPQVRELGDIPTILLSATRPPPGGSSEIQKIWLDVQEKFADSLPAGKLIVADGSGHHIQRDAPDLVVGAILELLGDASVSGLK